MRKYLTLGVIMAAAVPLASATAHDRTYYERTYHDHRGNVVVDAPTTYVKTNRKRTRVEAPFTSVDVDKKRRRVRISVPFYDGVVRW